MLIHTPDLISACSKAREIIELHGYNNPQDINLEDIAWKRRAVIRKRIISDCEALVVRSGKAAIITVSSDIREIGRERFTIAHEIGHLILHCNSGCLSACSQIDLFFYNKVHPEEREADKFATELLMPQKMFYPLCEDGQPNFTIIDELAKQFQTTLTATSIRFIECTPYPCALIAIVNGEIKWVKKSESFIYTPRIGKLNKNTYAMDCFSQEGTSNETHQNLAPHWLTDSPNEGFVILEQSKYLKHYNMVLTLLSYHMDESDTTSVFGSGV